MEPSSAFTEEGKRAKRRVYPCSNAQRGFWFEEQLHPRHPGLNAPARWRIDGELSNATIEQAWQLLFARHEVLRTHFEIVGGEPVQVVDADVLPYVTVHDLRRLTTGAAEIEAERLAVREAQTPFDLSVGPLLRLSRVILSDSRSILLLTAHHTVCDGWSVGILAREMGELCANLQSGEPSRLPDLPMQYGEFAEVERETLRHESFQAELAIARETFAGYTQFELLTDHPRPVLPTYGGRIASLPLDEATMTGLKELARQYGCTLFIASYAALVTLLHRYSGETDITIGTQVAGRDDDIGIERIVGCFMNTVALRGDLSGDPTFAELLERLTETVTTSFDLRHIPFARLVHMLEPKRDLSRSTLFSVKFGFYTFVHDAHYERFSLIDLPSCSAGALYDVNFYMVERNDGWHLACEYNTDLYDDETAQGLVKRMSLVMGSSVADPEQRISRLSLLSEADRYELVFSRNNTAAEYPVDKTVVDLFSDQVRLTPNAIAVVCGDTELTYAEVEASSNRLARELLNRALGDGKLVGVQLERSAELVVALLAVLKAGSAYIPLDPKFPRDRIGFVIENSRLTAIISNSLLRGHIDSDEIQVLRLDAEAAVVARNSPEPLVTSARSTDLAYVIYTSGSTGWPKGVQIEHRALVNLLCAMAASPGITAADVLVAVTTISFDIAALELFLPLISGARLVIVDESELIDGAALLRLMKRSGATIMQATPITWQLLIESGWAGQPRVKMLCGGEALSRKLADLLLQRGDELWNMYGPTETTIWSSANRVLPADGRVLVGGPIANTQFYVLDANGELAPPGVPGELVIGGDGVARGYLDRPTLTEERFRPDTFTGRAGAKLYHTGDIVRSSGNSYEFLGRNDQQVKIRGFRIELGEIEANLLRLPDVAEAVVVVRGSEADAKSIWAFVVGSPDVVASREAWAEGLRARLSSTLPQYMIPAPIVVMDALPRTPNAKVDRQALPQTANVSVSAHSEASANSTESMLDALISSMLGRQTIGRNENIFGLGFHSILAVRLVDEIERSTGARVPLRAIYDAQTIAQLALHIGSGTLSPPAVNIPAPVVTLNRAGNLRPFVFLHNDLLADGMYCRWIASEVGGAQPIHAIGPHGTAGLPTIHTVEHMALDFLPRIRSLQPRGPYRIGGFCVGGLVAYEIARLLREHGENVERLVLINALPLASRSIVTDKILRAVGLNTLLPVQLRRVFCSNMERLLEALAKGPKGLVRFAADRLSAVFDRLPSNATGGAMNFEAVATNRTPREIENTTSQLVASLTYKPRPYDGEVTLFWSTDERLASVDADATWSRLAKKTRLIEITGGHFAPVQDGVEALGRALKDVLS